jgi:hypothetical protein
MFVMADRSCVIFWSKFLHIWITNINNIDETPAVMMNLIEFINTYFCNLFYFDI